MHAEAAIRTTGATMTKGPTKVALLPNRSDDRLEMIEPDEEGGEPEGSHGGSEASAPTVVRRVVTLAVDGVPTECVDIQTLADELGTTVRALQDRERRGQIEFVRHQGMRYWPKDNIADLSAMLATDKQLGERLGVDRHTIANWRKGAPPGLSPSELTRYIVQKAETAPRTGKRHKPA